MDSRKPLSLFILVIGKITTGLVRINILVVYKSELEKGTGN